MDSSSPTPAMPGTVSGAPCWVSLMARDLEAAQEFYGTVLGWRFRTTSLGDEFSAALAPDGASVAGIGAVAGSLQTVVAWIPYFAVADPDGVAARIRERSATVAVGPLTLPTGRAALAADAQGATFGFWAGATVPDWSVGKGSAPAGLRLRTRDAFAAAIFYAEVLGWASGRPHGVDVQYEQDHVRIIDAGHTVAEIYGGALESPPDPHVRPRWEVYFRVPDVGAAAVAAAEAGGEVVTRPARYGVYGGQRTATLRDPDGGLFAVTGD